MLCRNGSSVFAVQSRFTEAVKCRGELWGCIQTRSWHRGGQRRTNPDRAGQKLEKETAGHWLIPPQRFDGEFGHRAPIPPKNVFKLRKPASRQLSPLRRFQDLQHGPLRPVRLVGREKNWPGRGRLALLHLKRTDRHYGKRQLRFLWSKSAHMSRNKKFSFSSARPFPLHASLTFLPEKGGGVKTLGVVTWPLLHWGLRRLWSWSSLFYTETQTFLWFSG